MNIFIGQKPKIIGATIYALNRTHGLSPAREYGDHETVTRVIDAYHGTVETEQGNVYDASDYNIHHYAN